MFSYLCTTCWELENYPIKWCAILPDEYDLIVYCNRKYRYNSEYSLLIPLDHLVCARFTTWMTESESLEMEIFS